MRLRQTVGTPARKASPSQNTAGVADFEAPVQHIDIIASCRIYALAEGESTGADTHYRGPRDAVTWLPGDIPAGKDKLVFLWAWGDFSAASPVWGTYVLRHNLPPPYTVTAPNMNSNAAGRIVFDRPQTGNWTIELRGPEGPLPAGWYIEVMKTAHEAVFDDTARPPAERIFWPEALSVWQAMRPSEIRFMNGFRINDNITDTDVSDYPPDSARNFRRMRFRDAVALCNYLNCAIWWCTPTNAGDAYIAYQARYVRDTLNKDLPVLIEHGNENWNAQFDQYSDSAATGMRVVGVRAPGTVTLLKGSDTLTATGVDLRPILGPTGAAQANRVAVGDHGFWFDRDTVTETTARTRFGTTAHKDLINVALYYASSSDEKSAEGYLVDAVNVLRIWREIFEETGEETRLTRVLGTQTANTGVTSRFLNDGFWRQAPGFVPTRRAADAVAVTSYWKNGFDRDTIRTLWDAGDTQGWREHFTTGALADIYGNIAHRLRAHRALAEPAGLRLICYEGGDHSISSATVSTDTDPTDIAVLAAYEDWLTSPDALPVWEAWRDLHVRFCDGPVSNYRISGFWGRFGFWGTYRDSHEPDYPRITVLKQEVGADPWWLPDYPPRWAHIPDQTLAAGATLDLTDWCSKNARHFSGTGPGGVTPVDGSLTMPGTAQAGAAYTFTAANDAGSRDVRVRIAVS